MTTTVTEAPPETECSWCGEELSKEEVQYPPSDIEEAICDDCYYEEYHYPCCRCGDLEREKLNSEGVKTGEPAHNMLVIYRPDEAGVELRPGVYRVVRWPYWTDAMLNAWVHEDCLRYLAPLEKKEHYREGRAEFGYNDYPCGHLCQSCQDYYFGKPLWWGKLKAKLFDWVEKVTKRWGYRGEPW